MIAFRKDKNVKKKINNKYGKINDEINMKFRLFKKDLTN